MHTHATTRLEAAHEEVPAAEFMQPRQVLAMLELAERYWQSERAFAQEYADSTVPG